MRTCAHCGAELPRGQGREVGEQCFCDVICLERHEAAPEPEAAED
ncbi:MAG: hypothetical protein ABEJ35_04955 [Halobacteriaceae archaeon]